MADRRVLITGVGPLCAVGAGRAEFWQGLLQGRRGVRTIGLFDSTAFACRIGGELVGFDVLNYAPRDNKRVQRYIKRNQKVMARDTAMAVGAAFLVFADAGLETDPEKSRTLNPARLGCNIGAGQIFTDMNELGAAVVTALEAGKFDLKRWGSEGMKNLPPLWLLKYLPNMLACHVTILHDCQGPSNTITCGEASGHLAIGEAFRTIQRGQADLAVCGGAETRLNCMGLLRQGKLDRLCVDGNDDPGRAVRPFDAARCGGVIGEGAGLLLLEEAEHARRRGASVYAELIGFGAGSDAYSSWKRHPEGRGQAVAVGKALVDAGRTPADIDLIVPYGSAVRDDDRAEAAALRTVFGEQMRRIVVTANKGGLGNCFAGAGALDAIEAALALREQTVPPTVNCDQPDAALGLNVAVGAPRTGRLRCAVVCGTAIGGQAAALVLARYEG